ncbi:MAG TPA: dual specificity protein phosphatase family protein [Methylotenera sp.]|nr:dual specificity protein phosphatase family protein [Methylotenera sp.]HPH06392.1 dual specificity protein phosphatase family protein [Methylotenera sp.]HPN01832.1 dual specificity protein phosphatase family protein [Methylotenera sp.]
MLNKTMFVGRATAETTPGWNNWAIISISEPDSAFGEAKLLDGWHALHRSEFHDIEVEMLYEPNVLMTPQHALEIVSFVNAIAPNVEGIMVHCKAGISRSAAVAKWIATAYKLQFNHEYSYYNKHVYNMLTEANKLRK